MSIDTAEATDTVASTPTSDTSTGDQSSQTDTSTQDTGDVQSASINADGSIRNPEALNRADSSTTPDTTSHTPQTGTDAPPAVNWQERATQLEQRYKALQGGYTRGQEQLKQFAGVDPAAVAAFKKQQADADAAKLKIWHPKNPQNAQFAGTRAKLDLYRSQLQGAKTPEARAMIEATAQTSFTPDEMTSIREWEGHKAQIMDRFASDPDSFIQELLDKKLESTIDGRFQTLATNRAATQDVERWFTNPQNAPIVSKYALEMRQALTDKVPWPYVRQMAMDRFRLEGVQSREAQASSKEAMAKAQIQAQKKNATITRDSKTVPKDTIAKQVHELAKKNKWDINDPRRWTETQRLTKLSQQ